MAGGAISLFIAVVLERSTLTRALLPGTFPEPVARVVIAAAMGISISIFLRSMRNFLAPTSDLSTVPTTD
jgi:hypothetical protein